MSVTKKEVKSATTVSGQHMETKNRIKRNKGQKEFHMNKQNVNKKVKSFSTECNRLKPMEIKSGTSSNGMKAKQDTGQMKSSKTHPTHAAGENADVLSSVDKHKRPVTSGTSKSDTGHTKKSLDTIKCQNGQIRRQKMEPNKLRKNAQRTEDKAGSLNTKLPALKPEPGKQRKANVVSDVTASAKKRERLV